LSKLLNKKKTKGKRLTRRKKLFPLGGAKTKAPHNVGEKKKQRNRKIEQWFIGRDPSGKGLGKLGGARKKRPLAKKKQPAPETERGCVVAKKPGGGTA